MARMDFLKSVGLALTAPPVLSPVSCCPPDGSQSQKHEEERLFCGLQFAPGSSQLREGGFKAAAALRPNSWRAPGGNGLQGEVVGFVRGHTALSCPSPSSLLGWRRGAHKDALGLGTCRAVA